MSLDLETIPESAAQGDLLEQESSPLTISLNDFVSEFGDELLDSLNRANPPVYTGQARPHRQLVLSSDRRSRRRRKSSTPSANCWSTAANVPRSSTQKWERARR